jgi:ParB/RepB/Spo0J family partition protein
MTAALPVSATAEQFLPKVLIADLEPSATNPRKTFDPQRLSEMARTISEHGILEPILARPLPGNKSGRLEIVAGERRWRAAQLAKRLDVPVILRPLTDKQALEIQTIENAQREDLHPLEQAAGYERLIKEFGYTPEKIADAIGKSRAHVFQIRKLGALSPKLREAFIAGEMDTTLATVFARVPGQSLQDAAWQKLKAEFRNGFSFRIGAEFVRKNFMLDLMRAPFNINDESLVVAAGACGKCPKRTGNQTDLFPTSRMETFAPIRSVSQPSARLPRRKRSRRSNPRA